MIFEFDSASLGRLNAALDAMEHRIEDFSVPLTDAAHLFEADIRNAFATGGASVGQDWDPLTQSTIDRMKYAGGKRGSGFGEGPTGNLLGAFHIFVRPFVAGVENAMPHAHLFENGRHAVTRLETAGGMVSLKHNPAEGIYGEESQPGREFMLITEETQNAAIDLILDYAVRDIAA